MLWNVDAFGLHPYAFPYGITAVGDWNQWQSMPKTEQILVDHGDGAKKIWATEFGAPTNGPAGSNYVSESTQADMLTKAYSLFASYSWSGPLFWYSERDLSSDPNSNDYSGIVRSDFSQKPSYTAYKQSTGTP